MLTSSCWSVVTVGTGLDFRQRFDRLCKMSWLTDYTKVVGMMFCVCTLLFDWSVFLWFVLEFLLEQVKMTPIKRPHSETFTPTHQVEDPGSRTRQNFELVHIIGPVQNFGPPARNFGPLKAEFAWWEWRKTLGGHVANWAGLSGFSPRENKISHTFFIDCINEYSKVSNAHNSDDCHGVFSGGMLNKGWSFSRSRFDCLGLMHFFHG